jgi:hypothetical protein
MKKHSLTLVACLLTLCGYSQTPQEVVAKMIRSKLGENCVIKDENKTPYQSEKMKQAQDKFNLAQIRSLETRLAQLKSAA